MRTSNPTSLRTDGAVLLRRLFETGKSRLRNRGVELAYSPAVVEWLLDHSDWQSSLNPLRTLDGVWHQQVASGIERLLLDELLREGVALTVVLGGIPTAPKIEFTFGSPVPEMGE